MKFQLKCMHILAIVGLFCSIEAFAENNHADIDYELLVKRTIGSSSEKNKTPDAIYAEMGVYKQIVRVQVLQDVEKLALEIVELSQKELDTFQQSADYSYQKETDYNPLQAMHYRYESFFMTHHHNDTPEELIGDALDFYYGRNQTKQNKSAAKFLLKELRTHKSTKMNKALDALQASGKVNFSF